MAERVRNLLQNLVITRIFEAPRELVWKAWTDPKFVVQWWGPRALPHHLARLIFAWEGGTSFA